MAQNEYVTQVDIEAGRCQDKNMVKLSLMKSHHLRCWDCHSLLNWTGVITSIAKTVSKNFKVLIHSLKCLSQKLCFNFAATSGLMLLIAT